MVIGILGISFTGISFMGTSFLEDVASIEDHERSIENSESSMEHPNGSFMEDSDESSREDSLSVDFEVPLGLAGLELFEAAMRPTDKTATVDVMFDKVSEQWKLSPDDCGTLESAQLASIKGRDKKVLVLCSSDMLAVLASEGCSVTAFDQTGQPLKHLTQVHQMSQSQSHSIPGFRTKELSNLRLSSHDAFKIHGLKDFLLYAEGNTDAIMAVTSGPYMRTWIVNLSELTVIMKDKWAYEACKETFFELHRRGLAQTVYLQLFDGDYGVDPETASMHDAQIVLPSFWMSQFADSVQSVLRFDTMKAFSFFSAEENSLDCPKLYVIHPNKTPLRARPSQQNPAREDGPSMDSNGSASEGHQTPPQEHVHFQPAAQAASAGSDMSRAVSAPVLAAEERSSTPTAAVTPVEEAPSSFDDELPALHHPWIQAGDTEHAFWPQNEVSELNRRRLERHRFRLTLDSRRKEESRLIDSRRMEQSRLTDSRRMEQSRFIDSINRGRRRVERLVSNMNSGVENEASSPYHRLPVESYRLLGDRNPTGPFSQNTTPYEAGRLFWGHENL